MLVWPFLQWARGSRPRTRHSAAPLRSTAADDQNSSVNHWNELKMLLISNVLARGFSKALANALKIGHSLVVAGAEDVQYDSTPQGAKCTD
jgi:hypothetical protein